MEGRIIVLIQFYSIAQGALFIEQPGCFTRPAYAATPAPGPSRCFTKCKSATIGITMNHCYCSLPTTLTEFTCYPPIQCLDGWSPCGYGEHFAGTDYVLSTLSISVYKLNACFLTNVKSIKYGTIVGVSSNSSLLEVGKSVTLTCTGGRYPNAGVEWWLSKTIRCIGVLTWENIVNTLQCNVACEKPTLENGIIIDVNPLNVIGKVNGGTTVTASCNDGFKLSSGTDMQTLACSEADAKWLPNIQCQELPACEKPALENGIISTYNVNSIGKVNLGTIVTTSCNDGFELSTGKDKQVLTCREVDAKWVPDVQCNELPACEKPTLVNGIISPYNVNSIGKVNAGTTVTVNCNDGFKLSTDTDTQLLTCQGTDTNWVPYLKCEPVCYLNRLKLIPYSIVSSQMTTTKVGNTINFACIARRYPNSGNQWWLKKYVACIKSKTWENVICSAACEDPVLANGKVWAYSLNTIGKVNSGTTATTNCDYGYKLSTGADSVLLTCQETDSQWTPQVSCKPVCYVQTLKTIKYSVVTGHSVGQLTVGVGETLNFACATGRYPNFGIQWWLNKPIKCIQSNTWENVVCSAACNVPILQNGKLSGFTTNTIGKVNARTTVISSCDYGFKLSTGADSQTLTCQETDSRWFPDITCQPICYLQTLQSITYSNVTGVSTEQTTVNVGTIINFGCTGPHYPISDKVWYLNLPIKCVKSATWEYNVQCRAACEKPILKNGQFDSYPKNNIDKVNAGTIVVSYCNYEFVLSSGAAKENLTCKEVDSQWSPDVKCLPRCGLLCVNNGTCVEDLLSGKQRCSCLLGFTGTLCDEAIPEGPHLKQLLKIGDQTALFTAVADMGVYAMAHIPIQDRIELEVPSNELIAECSLSRKSCGSFRQNAYVHMGSCYTINYENTTIMKQAGIGRGIHLVMFSNESEFLAHSLVKGVKLIIHNQEESVFPENQGRFLSPGFHVMIGIKIEKINKVDKRCASKGVLPSLSYFYNDTYTLEGCLKSCHQKKVIEMCGCGDPSVSLPKNIKLEYCSLKRRECVNSVKSITSQECRCPEACRTSIYKTTYSFAKWPAKNYNVPMCKYLSKKEKIWQDKWLKECNEAYRASHVKVDIYFEDLAYSVYTEHPVYTLWNLWSGIGSILAIFFGVSYIFFFESLVLMYELCTAAVKKCIRVWRKTNLAVSPEQNDSKEE